MTVRGSLKTMAVGDLLDWLERRGIAGELTMDRAAQTRRFQVAGGAVVGASSTDPTEYLGQILINSGVLSEAQLRDAYASQVSEGISLGKVLVLAGLASEEALRAAIEMKIREGFYDAMSWEDGSFQVDPQSGPRPLEVEVQVPMAALRAEGAERAEAWRKLRAEIPGDDTRFWVPDKRWLEKAKPGSPSRLILEDVERGLTVREIALARHAMPFPIYQRLSELMERGIVSIDRRKTVRGPEANAGTSAGTMIDAARGRARGGDRVGALELAKKALAQSPTDDAIKQAYGEIERALFAELSRALLGKFRVPQLLKSRDELARTPLSAEERYLVDRIDGRWDLLSLMRVSPLREVEALITFHRLAERGLIAL